MRAILNFRKAIALIAVIALGAACSRVETPKITPVVYTYYLVADADAAPLVAALADAYTKLNPNIQFRLKTATPEAVAKRVYDGQEELGVTGLLPSQAREGAWFGDLALDGVAVIANSANPAPGLSLPQLRDVFAGSRNQWSAFGALGRGEIEVAVRDAGDGSRAAFDRDVMNNVRLTTSAVVLPTSDVMMNYVALKPNAIGYVPLSHIRDKPNPNVKILAIDGSQPAPEALAKETYKPAMTVRMMSATEPQGELRRFVAWALGEQGQKIVEAENFVSPARR